VLNTRFTVNLFCNEPRPSSTSATAGRWGNTGLYNCMQTKEKRQIKKLKERDQEERRRGW
jgi:hypothetical protein